MKNLVEVDRESFSDLAGRFANPVLKYTKELPWERVEYATLDTYPSMESITNACDAVGLDYLISQDASPCGDRDGSEIITLFHVREDTIIGVLYLHCQDGRVSRFSGERNRHEFLVAMLRSGGIPDIEPIEKAKAYWAEIETMYGK